MLPTTSFSHEDYQNFVTKMICKYYPNKNSFTNSTWNIIERFWNIDLTYINSYLRDQYSKYGPKPRIPSNMHRSYLLSICLKVTSITEWVNQLRINPLYAILSGFNVDDTPGVGTFYDFFKRLWNSNKNNFSSNLSKTKTNVKRPTKTNHKAASVEKVTIDQLLNNMINSDFDFETQRYSNLFNIFKHVRCGTAASITL